MRTTQGRRPAGSGLTAALALASLLSAFAPAQATTLRRMELPELVGRADRIVHARALANDVHWNAAGTQILTDTTFEVLEPVKGQGPARLTVSMLGGRIDPVEMTAEGTPRFSPGEEVILFTSPRPDGMKNLVGFSQGVMRVREDPQTGEKFATSEVPEGVTMMQRVEGRPSVVPPGRLQAPLSAMLDELRRMTAAAAAGQEPSRPGLGLGAKPQHDAEGRP